MTRRPRGVNHDQARIRESADWAITAAGRRLRSGGSGRVTVADVIERARDDFGLEIDDLTARAMLRERFTLRGGGFGLTTDAWE